MNTQQIELVQRTFTLAAPMADEIANHFYQRLFELDPALRPLFHGDIQQQGSKLMTMLAVAVRGLDRPETILEPVRRLGERHSGYGVQPHHYATVGQALLWTLGQLFGPLSRQRSRKPGLPLMGCWPGLCRKRRRKRWPRR